LRVDLPTARAAPKIQPASASRRLYGVPPSSWAQVVELEPALVQPLAALPSIAIRRQELRLEQWAEQMPANPSKALF